MAGKAVTRAELSEAVYHKVGLSRAEAAALVEQVLGEISDTLVAGEPVKLSGFGNFLVRSKGERVGTTLRQEAGFPLRSARSWSSNPPRFSTLTSMTKPATAKTKL